MVSPHALVQVGDFSGHVSGEASPSLDMLLELPSCLLPTEIINLLHPPLLQPGSLGQETRRQLVLAAQDPTFGMTVTGPTGP